MVSSCVGWPHYTPVHIGGTGRSAGRPPALHQGRLELTSPLQGLPGQIVSPGRGHVSRVGGPRGEVGGDKGELGEEVWWCTYRGGGGGGGDVFGVVDFGLSLTG